MKGQKIKDSQKIKAKCQVTGNVVELTYGAFRRLDAKIVSTKENGVTSMKTYPNNGLEIMSGTDVVSETAAKLVDKTIDPPKVDPPKVDPLAVEITEKYPTLKELEDAPAEEIKAIGEKAQVKGKNKTVVITKLVEKLGLYADNTAKA